MENAFVFCYTLSNTSPQGRKRKMLMEKTEMKKEKIVRKVAGMTVPQQRMVYAYAHQLLSISRRRAGLPALPSDRPAPGQIVKVLSDIMEGASQRELVCIRKFAKDVLKNFRVG
jgi:hypothetical protein